MITRLLNEISTEIFYAWTWAPLQGIDTSTLSAAGGMIERILLRY
jgi:hypothetical protein